MCSNSVFKLLNVFLIKKKMPFLFIESVFETTEPYIYDSKNFSPTTGNKQTTSDVDMKTRGNVQLKCIAKSADYQHGKKVC